ncbi:MAG: bile acid:sodium symporter [Caulobacteraceae bacterium]|nr:bile acid:sodium symporter [Caulobacteraceae bacterium]
MVVLASLLPARGEAAVGLGWATKLAIALLFFLHGAKLSREAVIAGIAHWRLHLTVLASTFVLFPILGLGVMLLPETILPRQLALGVLFLCCLPSTVQSSIAFTAIARGNVAAAVCAASASNLFGIALTPLLAAMLMGTQGGFAPSAVEGVVVQLLAPFVAGQVARPWVGRWVDKHKRLTGLVDRGSILLVVYSAFSEAVVGGLWRKVDLVEIVILLIVCAALLVVVLAVTAYGSRLMGFDKEDEITIVFCGSKKSLASGVPLAGILFPGAAAGVMVLPLMLFHQIQLMACAVIAQRYAARAKAG